VKFCVLTVGNKYDRTESGIVYQHIKTDSLCTCASRQVARNTPRTVRHCQQALQYDVIMCYQHFL